MRTRIDTSQRMRNETGFTLLELLVAMFLLSMLTLVLYQSLHFGMRVWEHSEISSGMSNKVRILYLRISAEISRAYPLMSGDGTSGSLDFTGTKKHLIFYTPDKDTPGALRRVELKTQSDKHDTSLIYASTLELNASGSAKKQELLGGIKSLHIQYFGSSSGDASPAWHDHWKNRTSLPKLIRIGIVFKNKKLPQWPDLIASTHINADVGCVFDTLTHYCRGRE